MQRKGYIILVVGVSRWWALRSSVLISKCLIWRMYYFCDQEKAIKIILNAKSASKQTTFWQEKWTKTITHSPTTNVLETKTMWVTCLLSLHRTGIERLQSPSQPGLLPGLPCHQQQSLVFSGPSLCIASYLGVCMLGGGGLVKVFS